MEAIVTKNLSKIYNHKKVVDDLNITVSYGSVFGFLGPNGAGKTTTIRMFLNLVKPDTGEIHILGFDLKKNYREISKYVGAIVENPTFFPNLNAIQTLETFTDYCSLNKTRNEFESLLDKCGILYASKQKVNSYSLGMKQRLGLAVALLNNPQIIFLDEPTNGLDPEGIIETRKLIRYLAENEKRTIFVSSHLLHEVEKTCDEIAILKEGKVINYGKVSDLLDNNKFFLKVHPRHLALEVIKKDFPNLNIETESSENILSVKIKNQESEIPQIIKKLVYAGIDIHEVINKSQTLEDFFHQTIEKKV